MITDGSQITDLRGSYIKASDDTKEEQLKNYKPVVSDPENMNPNQSFVFRPKEEVRSNNDSNKQKKHANLRNTPPKDIDGKMVLKPKNINEKYKELEEIKKLKQEVEELKTEEGKAQMNVEELNAQINSDSKKNKRTMAKLNKAYNEWSAINSEYQKKLAEYNKKKAEIKKKYQQRKNDNSRGKDNQLLDFIQEQMKQSGKHQRRNNPVIRYLDDKNIKNFYGKTMRLINNNKPRTSKKNVNTQKEKGKDNLLLR